MNERIKELWNKAAESTAAFPSGQNNSWEVQTKFMERFAELIVKECTLVACPLYMEASKAEVRGMEQLLDKIYEHFGVE